MRVTVGLLAGSCNVGKFRFLDGLVALMHLWTCRQYTGRGGAHGGRKKRGKEGMARFNMDARDRSYAKETRNGPIYCYSPGSSQHETAQRGGVPPGRGQNEQPEQGEIEVCLAERDGARGRGKKERRGMVEWVERVDRMGWRGMARHGKARAVGMLSGLLVVVVRGGG